MRAPGRGRPLLRNPFGVRCCCFGQIRLVLLETSVFSDCAGSQNDRLFLFRDLRQCAFDVELFITGEREARELARGGEAVDNVVDARARREGREEYLYFFRGGGDGRLQIERDEDGERGGLRMGAADVQLATVARAEQLPMGPLRRIFRGHGHNPHGVPELRKRTQDRSFGDLATETRAQLDGGESAFAFEQLVGFGGERRDAGTTNRRGGALGIALGLHRVEIGERLGRGEEVRVFADKAGDTDAGCGAEEIERDDGPRCDEAREHLRGSSDVFRAGRGTGAASDGLHEAGRGHGQMLAARQIEAQGRLGEPALGIVEREQRVAVLTPACVPGLFQLILIHDFRS